MKGSESPIFMFFYIILVSLIGVQSCERGALNASLLFTKAVLRDGFSCGMRGTGKTPQWSKASEEAYRPPHGKRPFGAEINRLT